LLAAMFTIAWMQRHNEMLPLLSAGVSMRRIVLPLIVCSCILLSLAVLNQELLIPHLGAKILMQKDDPDGDKEVFVSGRFESNLIHIEGGQAQRKEMIVRNFHVVMRGGSLVTL